LLDAQELIDLFGPYALAGVCLILFLETSTVILSFLPGDSLLFVFGLSLSASSNVWLNILSIPLLVIAAIAGSQVGFVLGRRIGPSLLKRGKRNWLVNENSIAKSQEILDRYGPRAIVLARFIPVLRALVPMLVGIMGMDGKKYLRYNFLGAILWAGGLTLLGWGLGNVPVVQKHLELWIIGFVILSSLPLPFEIARESLRKRKSRKATATQVQSES